MPYRIRKLGEKPLDGNPFVVDELIDNEWVEMASAASPSEANTLIKERQAQVIEEPTDAVESETQTD